MKIVLATGIYPPEIGGPATYVAELSQRLVFSGMKVKVITYGNPPLPQGAAPVICVPRWGGMLMRWHRYNRALKQHAADADIVYAFSSVSAGVPLWMSHLKHPRKVLRLGGDFLWERYTDRGGQMGLKEWYDSRVLLKSSMNGLLRTFDHLIFSTDYQRDIYDRVYSNLPPSSVIHNALPDRTPALHTKHDPFRLLYLGRFVAFKNLASLVMAVKELPGVTLTLVGEGPLEKPLQDLIESEGLKTRVHIQKTASGSTKDDVLLHHDLLVLPSFTELSPNTALEARSLGLPVLLTEETGLSRSLMDGTQLRTLRSPRDIANAIREMEGAYPQLAQRASLPLTQRTWDTLAQEHIALFRSLV